MVDTIIVPLLKIAVLINALLVSVTFLVLMERKVIAWAQSRLGPMRAGPYGILQALADPIKLILKEDITPAKADKYVFTLAPIMSLVPALVAFAVIPFGPEPFYYISDINIGLLFILSGPRLVSTASFLVAGPPTVNTHYLLACARLPSSSAMRLR
jgi:NADH-quinone oxidoreductase subunit H